MTPRPYRIPAAGPRATALALDLADFRAGGPWLADFEAAPATPVEEAALLVSALAHGASGALVDGRPLEAPTALSAAIDEGEAGTPVALVSRSPAESETVARWHATCWEAGFALSVRGADAPLEGACIVFADDSLPESELRAFAESGAQVVRDLAIGALDVGILDSGFLVDRISRAASRPSPPAAGAPGQALVEVAPVLKRAMDLVSDPAPAPRVLSVAAPVLVDAGERIAAHPAGGAAIARERIGTGAIWTVSALLDAATRRGLLALVAAHARVLPVRPGLPDGVEAAMRGAVLLLVNHADRAREFSGVFGRDLVSGAECTGHVVVGARSAMALLPR